MANMLVNRLIRPCVRYFRFPIQNQVALISTTKKNKDTLVYPDDLFPKKMPPPPKTVEDFAETKNPKVIFFIK